MSKTCIISFAVFDMVLCFLCLFFHDFSGYSGWITAAVVLCYLSSIVFDTFMIYGGIIYNVFIINIAHLVNLLLLFFYLILFVFGVKSMIDDRGSDKEPPIGIGMAALFFFTILCPSFQWIYILKRYSCLLKADDSMTNLAERGLETSMIQEFAQGFR